MTQSEIDEAAERLEKYYGVVVEPTGNIRACGNDVLEAMEVLAMAYLSDRAARLAQEREDAEPITDERLIACGFTEDQDDDDWCHLFRHGRVSVDRSEIGGTISNHWTICDDSINFAVTIPPRRNMGDVRRLIEALAEDQTE